jgi:hypothetical protein
LKPELFARKYGDFFRRAHTFGKVDAKDFTERGFALEMSDVEGYLFVAPISIGFMKHTLTAMGCKGLKISEVSALPSAGSQSSGTYRFEVTWGE